VVKFLAGSSYNGDTVPVCTFWRNDLRTDPSKDISEIETTGETYAQAGKGKDSAIGNFNGQCIANAFYPKDSITCFNEGRCNEEGKCLPCFRYKAGGMKLAITHSPPRDILRFFNSGLDEFQIQSPNLVSFPPNVVNRVETDQLPYHILIRNIQAELAKCCHWDAGDGVAGVFFTAVIQNGPDTVTFKDAAGNDVTLRGITVKNEVFPDEVGSFFPVGSVVVAGFEDQPSFYLEPRTGLVKPGEDVIFSFEGDGVDISPAIQQTKQIASDSNQVVTDSVNAAGVACVTADNLFARDIAYFNNAANTGDPQTIAAAQAKAEAAAAASTIACDAADGATVVGQEAIDLIAATINAANSEDLQTSSTDLTVKLVELADLVETAGAQVGGTTAADQTAKTVNKLRTNARFLEVSARGGTTKCEFFFNDTNIAEIWNSPTDGTLPCNGVRTDCDFYTGQEWKFATDELMEIGRPIVGEQIQEIRARSDDWSRFDDPDEEFASRFNTPFIWAFKGYVDVNGEPDLTDMAIYKSKVIGSRADTDLFSEKKYQQIIMDKVTVTDYEDFAVSKQAARTVPGSETLDRAGAPQFPSLITEPVAPGATRLSITHPRVEDEPFPYRFWTPDKNTISLFGKSSPDNTIFLINETALKTTTRLRYQLAFKEQDFFDVPDGIPSSPTFNGLLASELLGVVDALRKEKFANPEAITPLGYDEVTADRSGFWSSIGQVDLVHNTINTIHAFLIASETNVLTATITVDARWLHAYSVQTKFEGIDFTILNLGADSKLGTNSGDTAQKGLIEIETRQVSGVRQEVVNLNNAYFGWRFKDRGLRFGALNADNDLLGQNPIADQVSTFLITEAAPSEFIANVGYHVVQYQVDEITIASDAWYLIDDCGKIMIRNDDRECHRVLPLENQQGFDTPLTNILINGGGTGSEIAQWGLTSVTLVQGGEERELVQFFRDPDGVGLPANYVIVGPDFDDPSRQSAFGRANPETDTIKISYTFLRAQSTKHDPLGSSEDAEDEPETGIGEVVNTNFHGDSLRSHRHKIEQSGNNLTAGGETFEDRISQDQQDYVLVYADSDGRPIGRKVTSCYVMYYNLTCINVEIFYKWSSECTVYALLPDFNSFIGDAGGTNQINPDATDDPNNPDLQLGFRISNLLGRRLCTFQPNCGDHEIIRFGPLRREFEVIVNTQGQNDDGTPAVDDNGEPVIVQKAAFPSAGGPVVGEIVSTELPGSQFQVRHGPMWYPYDICERPRYRSNTGGPLHTDTTELINTTQTAPGYDPTNPVFLQGSGDDAAGAAFASAQTGVFGGLPDRACETHHAADQMVAKILDTHPSLRACSLDYTYGNAVNKSGTAKFIGYARRRGVIDRFLYEGIGWADPPFGNFGRPRLTFEMSNERGDYLGGANGKQVGRRWMPMYPKRENVGATTDVFSESIEPQALRLTCDSNPVGSVNEVVEDTVTDGFFTGSQRFTHKQIIANRTAAAIEFPFNPFFPMFLPDGSLGEDAGGRVPIEEGSVIGEITTMWAWREGEKSVRRGIGAGGNIIQGLRLQHPDYFIDNRRLEIRLRPPEGDAQLLWTPPQYKLEDGTMIQEGSLQLRGGPPRPIVIDFVNRKFELGDDTGTVYEPVALGEGALVCAEVPSDNDQMAGQCTCITNINDPALRTDGESAADFPSRFLHLDEIAPEGFVGLYTTDEIQTPFLVDIPRSSNEQPCCMCVRYIPGIFFRLSGDLLPSIPITNVARETTLNGQYTWSRVPHGLGDVNPLAADDLGANEQLGDNLRGMLGGKVFRNHVNPGLSRIPSNNNDGAIFPSSAFAQSIIVEDEGVTLGGVTYGDTTTGGILVFGAFDAGDPRLKGGIPANAQGFSQGQNEQIVLTMTFDTYIRINRVEVTFFAGTGWESPRYKVAVVPPANRTNFNSFITNNSPLIVGTAAASATGTNIPGREFLDDDAVAEGNAPFRSIVVPGYDNLPFWESFGMEWQLIFPARGTAQSMGIFAIEITADAMTTGNNNSETIGIRERKYYRSKGSIPGDLNPERFLQEIDSATVYWRSTERGNFKGGNRHRAYAWGNQIDDNQDREENSNIDELESLQEEEYDTARGLLDAPYVYEFSNFIPFDEQTWIDVTKQSRPSWSMTAQMEISPLGEILNANTQTSAYGVIPQRSVWNAPGHAWIHDFDDTYVPCCFGCFHSKIVTYKYQHLHDNLGEFEPASFWSELPSGFTRLIRSTMGRPTDFQGLDAGDNIVLIEESQFRDQQGNAISTSVLNAAGFTRDPDSGEIYIERTTPQAAVGGPAGPTVNCGGGGSSAAGGGGTT